MKKNCREFDVKALLLNKRFLRAKFDPEKKSANIIIIEEVR